MRPHDPYTLPNSPNTLQIDNSLFNPPIPRRKRRKVKAVPIRTIEDYEVVHRAASTKFDNYAASKRSNYQKLAPWVAHDSDWRNARYLNANNIEGRIDFAKLMLAGIADNPDILSGPLHFVTIVSRDYVVPIEDAMVMSHDKLKKLIFSLCQLTRQALKGLTFIGIVEPALYKDWGATGPSLGRDHLHWHVHVIVWGHTLEQIKLGPVDGFISRIPAISDR